MAYKEGDLVEKDETYILQSYAFKIERRSVTSSQNDQITAVCEKANGKTARQAIQIPSSYKVDNYYVEANGTTADVYAVVGVPTGGSGEYESTIDVSVLPQAEGYPQPVPTGNGIVYFPKDHPDPEPGWPTRTQTTTGMMWIAETPTSYYWGVASRTPGTITYITDTGEGHEPVITTRNLSQASTLLGTTYYRAPLNDSVNKTAYEARGVMYQVPDNLYDRRVIETIIIDGVTRPVDPEYEEKEMLVGRFAIELKNAGGVGPVSDWGDPGDWNDDWEPGDPTQTLQLTVDGALSGRHNDPLNDTSYSYVPSDKATIKDYGCGGDGGHGGGGGAGASSIVVYKFATDKAGNKEIICKPKRHGYGSGGGKGGKGGDGCILIYY